MAKHCETCRWWSHTCAESIGGAPMRALCENAASPKAGRMTPEMDTCEAWEKPLTRTGLDDGVSLVGPKSHPAGCQCHKCEPSPTRARAPQGPKGRIGPVATAQEAADLADTMRKAGL